MPFTTRLLKQDLQLMHIDNLIKCILPNSIMETFKGFSMEYDTMSLRRRILITIDVGGPGWHQYRTRQFYLPEIHRDINVIEFVARKVKEFYYVVKG